MKKLIGLVIMCIALFTACETELESHYNNTNLEIIPDPSMNPGSYQYSDLADEIQVTFLIDSLTSSVEVTAWKGKTLLNTKTAPVGADGRCVVTYKATDLGMMNVGDTAILKVVNGSISTKVFVTYVSCWIDFGINMWDDRDDHPTIVSGVTFTPIDTKSTTDTIHFRANVPEWVSTENATWTMSYKIGKSGVEHPVTPALSTAKDQASFIKPMKGLGVAGDTVTVKATITNNGITRSGEYKFIIEEISEALTSKTRVNAGFNPSVSNAQTDTISMSATSLKKQRGWLNLSNATWDVSYTVGASGTKYPIQATAVNNDTMSVMTFSAAMGQLQGVSQYDTVKVKGVMNIDGATYPINYSFKVQK